ncbi:MAG: AbrB/MazE/SpoVT family DNA-binding domain-containing protein [Acidobacteriota bacterium]|nr:AbrB/MazE/SpoVT family DNA-binding domain-containing protein [Acidobacteriota bacterium]MDE2965289.1 AbrB/MazE/SpoVT family DNA-binding domain-containing protein [Acidobacteriota bacterium]
MANEKPFTPRTARRARLFRIGRDQAVRIPREFELNADEVLISREGDRLVVVPVQKRPSLADVLSRLKPMDEDFPNSADPPTEPQDLL